MSQACAGELDPSQRPNPKDAVVPPEAAPYVGGTLSIGDNGTAADDAFGVYIDGVAMGQTSIGASNTVSVGALRPGTHTVTVQVITAPDNLGTFALSVGGGLRFSDGTTAKSATPPAGASVSYTIVVPANGRTSAVRIPAPTVPVFTRNAVEER